MKFNLLPPAIIIEQERSGGEAKGPVVFVPLNVEKHLLEHELFHVKQFWCLLVIPYMILMNTKWGQFRLEAAAYGHAMEFVEDDDLDGWLEARVDYLYKGYKHGYPRSACRTQIMKKYLKGGLL